MKKTEYEITKHSAQEFSKLIYFCTEEGKCTYEQLHSDQLSVLEKLLNERGADGWELVQISFGTDGFVAFWKRDI
jgi:hypothetical protein